MGPGRTHRPSCGGGSPPGPQVDPLQRRRERGCEEEREHEAEDPRRPANVIRGGERLLRGDQRITLDPEPVRQGSEDRVADALRHERGDDDDQRKERDECLAGQCDAAVDELDLEHAVPHLPQERPLRSFPDGRHSITGTLQMLGDGWTFVRTRHDQSLHASQYIVTVCLDSVDMLRREPDQRRMTITGQSSVVARGVVYERPVVGKEVALLTRPHVVACQPNRGTP